MAFDPVLLIMQPRLIDEAIDEYQVNESAAKMIQIYKDLDKKFKKYDTEKIYSCIYVFFEYM